MQCKLCNSGHRYAKSRRYNGLHSYRKKWIYRCRKYVLFWTDAYEQQIITCFPNLYIQKTSQPHLIAKVTL